MLAKNKGKVFLLIVFLILSSLLVYGFTIEPNALSLQVNLAKIEDLPESWDNVKISYFTDLSISDNYKAEHFQKVLKQLEDERPDIVFFSGDFLSDEQTLTVNDEQIITLLRNIKAPLGKFAITSFRADALEQSTRSDDLLKQSGFQLINNTSVNLYNRSLEPLNIIGINEGATEDEVNELLGTSNDRTSLLFTTMPNVYNQVTSNHKIRYTFASTTYGGLVNLPVVKPLIIQKEPTPDYWKGIYNRNSINTLLVSQGIGVPDHFKFRLFNQPTTYTIVLQSTTLEKKTDKQEQKKEEHVEKTQVENEQETDVEQPAEQEQPTEDAQDEPAQEGE